MEKKTWIWALVASLYTIILAVSFFNMGAYFHKDVVQTPPLSQTAVEESQALEATPAPSMQPAETYVVKESNGQIIVYHDNAIIEQLNVDVSLLPAQSRALLKEGITVESKQQLAELLEDYAN